MSFVFARARTLASLALVGALATTPCISQHASAAAPTAAPTPIATKESSLGRLTSVQCSNFAQLQTFYKRQIASRMTDWATTQLSDMQNRPVLYLFSGPDIVTTMALFPTATHLTLVADQKPEYELLTHPDSDNPAQTERECRMLSYFSQLGYYRTDDLNGKKGTRPRFIKLLAYSIAFGGATVSDAQLLAIGAKGELEAVAPGTDRAVRGVRFDTKRADGKDLQIDYLEIDLSNHGLKASPGAMAFLHQSAGDILFLKSASHLLQSPHFSLLADMLVTPPAPFVVQDETGLGIDQLRKSYQLSLYGRFTGPQALWAKSPAAHALADDYATHQVSGPLPFKIGYEKKSGSALLVGRHALK